MEVLKRKVNASWRSILPIHPAAELFPPMSPDELAALGKDIRKHGLTLPIFLWSDGKSPLQLLEGRSRLDAIEIEIGPAIVSPPSVMAGKDFIAVKKVTVLPPSVDPYAFVVSANIRRRHLSAEQKRDLIAKLIKATPGKSDRQIAETVKASHHTVGSVRANLEGRGQVAHVTTRTDSKGRKQPARKTRGRVKFTPERIEQIRNLVGRGKSREEISETIGVTVGLLQVTCSRLGISLRKPLRQPVANDEIGSASAGEIARKQAEKRRLEIENIGLHSEVEETKAVLKPEGEDKGEGEGEGEDSELGNLLRAWDCASQGAREKFKARVGLVAVEPRAGDGLDIPECLRRAAP
jgi:transposase